MNYDYLIVGQGLAGTLLSHFLLREGKKIMVADAYDSSSSSNVAAGIINPITGRLNQKSWLIDELLPFAETTYHRLEEMLGGKFYFQKNIYRIFSSENDRRDVAVKSTQEEFSSYIKETEPLYTELLKQPFGSFIIQQSAFVLPSKMIALFRNYLRDAGGLTEEHFNYNELSITKNCAVWKGMTFKKVIFCEGYHAAANPWFKWLPFVPSKGELLTLRIPGMDVSHIIHKNIFILPLGNDLFKVGATFDWDDLSNTPTPEAREELLGKLNDFLKIPYEVVEHHAAVRPSVQDRRPFIGVHPEHSTIAIFNGMGTKGVSLAPWLARHFTGHIEQGNKLIPEVDISRFARRLKN